MGGAQPDAPSHARRGTTAEEKLRPTYTRPKKLRLENRFGRLRLHISASPSHWDSLSRPMPSARGVPVARLTVGQRHLPDRGKPAANNPLQSLANSNDQ